MAGREKIKLYSYNLEGKDAQKFESTSDFRRAYYSDIKGKKPIFTHNTMGLDYGIHKDRIVFKSPVGRKKAVLCYRIHTSPYVKNEDKLDIRPIQVLNLEGEVIAEFKTLRLLTKLTNINPSLVTRQLTSTTTSCAKTSGLTFKYKE